MTGSGPTPELRLRVSAAALARVVFANPRTGERMLALERKASAAERQVGTPQVIAQPFGGGIHLLQPEALWALIGDFHFDSPRSQAEADFRILIRPAHWSRLKQWCLNAFRLRRTDLLELDPARELAEEFWDALRVEITPAQYRLRPLEVLVENSPVPSGIAYAHGMSTVRIYAVSEAQILDPALAGDLLAASALTDADLLEQARVDAGGRGRANGVLALPIDRLVETYRTLLPERRGEINVIEGRAYEGNVAGILPGVPTLKYERYPLQG